MGGNALNTEGGMAHGHRIFASHGQLHQHRLQMRRFDSNAFGERSVSHQTIGGQDGNSAADDEEM